MEKTSSVIIVFFCRLRSCHNMLFIVMTFYWWALHKTPTFDTCLFHASTWYEHSTVQLQLCFQATNVFTLKNHMTTLHMNLTEDPALVEINRGLCGRLLTVRGRWRAVCAHADGWMTIPPTVWFITSLFPSQSYASHVSPHYASLQQVNQENAMRRSAWL